MISISQPICDLHQAYCTALGLDLPMNASFERMYFGAIQMGLTPEFLGVCIKERMRLNRTSSFKMKLGLINLIGSEDAVGQVLNEVAVVLSSQRKKVMDPAKASVLRQTGRSDQVPVSDGKVVGDLLENLRKSTL